MQSRSIDQKLMTGDFCVTLMIEKVLNDSLVPVVVERTSEELGVK